MSMDMMPMWVRVFWVTVLTVALASHLRHAYHGAGQHRWWVLGHTAMAVAMIPMYMPELLGGSDMSQLGLRVFALAALTIVAVSIAMRHRENVLNPLWVMLAVDLAIMAYMWLPTAKRSSVIDNLLVAYLVCQVLAHIVGIWERVPALERSMPGGRHSPRPPPTIAVVGLTAHTGLIGRSTLAVMAASMGYMLMAM